MKRFLIFAYDTCYPSGGWNDLEASSDDLDEAMELAAALRDKFDRAHIVDTQQETEEP